MTSVINSIIKSIIHIYRSCVSVKIKSSHHIKSICMCVQKKAYNYKILPNNIVDLQPYDLHYKGTGLQNARLNKNKFIHSFT